MKITYWSDYACPYCFIGKTRLEKAIQELGLSNIEIEMKSFELDPSAPKEFHGTTLDRFAKKYSLSKENAYKQIETISSLGKEEGIDFRYGSTRYTNTFDAHRLTKRVQSNGNEEKTNQFIHDVFDAYFTRNLELSDPNVLMECGLRAGLLKEEIEQVLKSDAYANEVRQDEYQAQMCDVHGVPFFVVDDRYSVSGAQSKEAFKEILKEISLKDMEGMTCGINGCL